MVALDVLPDGPLEIGDETEDPGAGEAIFDRLDDGILKVTVEDRRIRNPMVILQAEKGLLVVESFFSRKKKEGCRNIDSCFICIC